MATPTTRASWLTVTMTPVASAASVTGARITTEVIGGRTPAAMPAPISDPRPASSQPPGPPSRRSRGQGGRPGAVDGEAGDDQRRVPAGGQALPVQADERRTPARPARSEAGPQRRVARPPCRCSASRRRTRRTPPSRRTVPRSRPPSRAAAAAGQGISGEPPRAAALRSTTANSANSTPLPARQAQPGAGQCSDWPSTKGRTRASTAGVNVANPARSRVRPGSPRPFGRVRSPARNKITPNRNVQQKYRSPGEAQQVQR